MKSAAAASQTRLAQAPSRRQELAAIDRESEILSQEVLELEKKQEQSGLVADMEKREQGRHYREIDPAILPDIAL